METSRGFQEYPTNQQELTTLVRGEFKKMSPQQVVQFIKNVEDATGQVDKIQKTVKVQFGDATMELTLVEAKDLLHQIKPMAKQSGSAISELFKKVHNQVKEAIPLLTATTIPTVGRLEFSEVTELLKGQAPGVFIVATPIPDFRTPEDSLCVVTVTFAQQGNNPYEYKLDLKNDGQFYLRGRPEVYPSLKTFIENRQQQKGRLTTALAIENPHNTTTDTKKTLSEGLYSYFPGMTYDRALSLLQTASPGTYLICDRVKDADGKVVIYKASNGDICADVLTLSASELQGYDCNGKWYPSFQQFMNEDLFAQDDKKYLHPFKKSAEMVLAEREHAKTEQAPQQEVIPCWKTALYEEYKKELETNPESAAQLMQKACQNGDFEIMKWLAVNHGVPLPAKEGLAEEQKAQIDWLQQLLNMPTAQANDTFLNHAALTVGYGYKTANLMVQEVHAQAINQELEVAAVDVPAKLPFSDFEMRQHLKPIMGELEGMWQQFLATFSEEDKSRIKSKDFDAVATPIQISTEGQKILDTMQEKIALHFRQFPFYTPELEAWIKNNPSEFYIVRSTGREDTRDNPNPGGNETIPNVTNNSLAISCAIGDVLKSYCGLKSVTQRLMVGDAGLFTEPLFLPVLLMKQVSEKVNGAETTSQTVPRSGVLITGQPGGVTLMQVGLGHCSGVVESKVAVDTYYVDSHLAVRETIREKNSRYVPTQASSSSPVKLTPTKTTDPALAKGAALPTATAQDMKRVADYFSKAYGTSNSPAAMDMEFTITTDSQGKPLINLLQIRPFVEKKALQPSYLSGERLSELPEQNRVSVHTLLGGSAGVERLTSPSNVLFVDNLPQALSRYLKTVSGSIEIGSTETPAQRKSPPKVIFTRQASHLTSHEAIFFRNRGVVIYVVDEQSSIDTLRAIMTKASEGTPVLACSQRGVVVDTHGIDTTNCVVKGFASYPSPLELSIPTNPMLDRKTPLSQIELRTRILNINNRFSQLQEQLLGKQPDQLSYIQDATLSSLLDKAATATDPQVARQAIATILKIMNQQLNNCISGEHPVGPTLRLELLHTFNMALKMVESGLLDALSGDLTNPEVHMNRLFHLKSLEALVEQPAKQGVVASSSWKQLLRAGKREAISQETVGGSVPTHERATILKTIANLGVHADVRKEWHEFINNLAATNNPKYLGQAADLVAAMTRLGITASWMNLIFHNVASQGEPAEKTLELLLAMQKENEEQISWAQEQLETISTLRQQTEEWATPEFTERNIKTLRDTFTNALEMIAQGQKPNFINRLEQSSLLGKLVLLETFRQAIDVYDKTIKAVTASADYPENGQLKAQHFAKLLVGYLRMLEGAYMAFTPEEEKNLIKHNWDNKPLHFSEIARQLEHGFSIHPQDTPGLAKLLEQIEKPSTNFQELLQARPEFSAIPFVPGQHVDLLYGVEWPETLEETFTTIHQTLEGVRRQLLAKTGEIDTLLEGRVESLASTIAQQMGQKVSYFNMDGSRLELVFQIPLRQHSCTLKLEVDVAHPERGVVLKGETFGAEEHNRWAQTATYGAFFGCTTGRTQPAGAVSEINYDDPRGAVFTVALPAEALRFDEDRHLVRQIHDVFVKMSMSHSVTCETVVKELGFILNDDWSEVNLQRRFFSQCPYISLTLLEKFAVEGKKELLINTAVGALEALITYGLDDYKVPREKSTNPFADKFKSDPRFSEIAGIQEDDGTSLRIAATCFLLKMLDENPELARPYVQKLLSNPELQQRLPSTAALLEAKCSV